MKRSALLRKTPMKRSALSIKPMRYHSRPKKKRPGHDKAMLDACRGQQCYLAIHGVCRGETETVVPAHRNEGKGMGLKVPDEQTVPACFWCHQAYDQSGLDRAFKRSLFDWAYTRWSAVRDGVEKNG